MPFRGRRSSKDHQVALCSGRSDSGVKLPRELIGAELIGALRRLGYRQTRQTGSHVRMTVLVPSEGHLTIPLTRALPPGILAALLKDAARQLDTTVEDLLSRIG